MTNFAALLAVGSVFLLLPSHAMAQYRNECIAMSGDIVQNTCGSPIDLAWYDDGRQQSRLLGGESEKLSGFGEAPDHAACSPATIEWNGNSPYCDD